VYRAGGDCFLGHEFHSTSSVLHLFLSLPRANSRAGTGIHSRSHRSDGCSLARIHPLSSAEPVSQRVDFSRNASIYDRRHRAVLAQDIALKLASKGELPREACVLDIGAGTGRVAITFAAIEFKTVALDPALDVEGIASQSA